MSIKIGVVFTVLISMATPALAHHSFAMFDRTRDVTLTGTVKEFQWTNPHVFVQMVVNEQGKGVEYSLEAQSVNMLVRKGWRPSSLKPGTTVKVTFYPLRNGAKGGQLRSVVLPDGKTLQTSY